MSNSLKALITFKNFDPKTLAELSTFIDVEEYNDPGRPSRDELLRYLHEYDILIIGISEQLTSDMFSTDMRVRIIATSSVGLDHIADVFIRSSFVKVISLEGANSISVAEHTVAMILASLKRFDRYLNSSASIDQLPTELAGKTIGIIGFGNIGRRVSSIAAAFDVSVICATKHPEKYNNVNNLAVAFVDLPELASRSDIVTLHCPLNDETAHIISHTFLSRLCKPTIIINTAREGLIDHKAVVHHVEHGQIVGVAYDDISDKNLLLYRGLDRILYTPHIAGNTSESNHRMDVELGKKVITLIQSL